MLWLPDKTCSPWCCFHLYELPYAVLMLLPPPAALLLYRWKVV